MSTASAGGAPFAHRLLWERLDEPGWEAACAFRTGAGWAIESRYVGRRGGGPVAAHYELRLDANWATLRLEASWGLGPDRRTIVLERTGGGWRVDGVPQPALDGCVDVDVRWTPLTNTLPIRRLGLAPGAAREIDVAWIAEVDLSVHRNAQRYTRLADRRWRFEALENGFAAEIEVDGEGFVLDYPALFRRLV